MYSHCQSNASCHDLVVLEFGFIDASDTILGCQKYLSLHLFKRKHNTFIGLTIFHNKQNSSVSELRLETARFVSLVDWTD